MGSTSFGDRVRELRALVEGLSQRELDGLAGLSPGHVWHVERGRDNVKIAVATALSRVLGASLDWLIRGYGVPPCACVVRTSVSEARNRVALGAACQYHESI